MAKDGNERSRHGGQRSGPGQPVLVALGLKDAEITNQLDTATAAIIELRRMLPDFNAADINAWSESFGATTERLGAVAATRKGLLSRVGIKDTTALKEALGALSENVRASIEEAEKRLKRASFNLRRELRSLSYFARLHLSHLDGILSAIGEATGLMATYTEPGVPGHPSRPIIPGNFGIVDATA